MHIWYDQRKTVLDDLYKPALPNVDEVDKVLFLQRFHSGLNGYRKNDTALITLYDKNAEPLYITGTKNMFFIAYYAGASVYDATEYIGVSFVSDDELPPAEAAHALHKAPKYTTESDLEVYATVSDAENYECDEWLMTRATFEHLLMLCTLSLTDCARCETEGCVNCPHNCEQYAMVHMQINIDSTEHITNMQVDEESTDYDKE